jgi:hypothetical protein
MTLYVNGRIKTLGIKRLEGKEAIDFVAEVLTKVAEGKRDWGKANCSFEDFLWGCLRSDLHGFFKKSIPNYLQEFGELEDKSAIKLDMETKASIIQKLEEVGADDDELIVFECWTDGITKPRDIVKELGIDLKQVNNITKRIKRRLPKIHTLTLNLL